MRPSRFFAGGAAAMAVRAIAADPVQVMRGGRSGHRTALCMEASRGLWRIMEPMHADSADELAALDGTQG